MSVRFYPAADGPLLADFVRDTGPRRRAFRRVRDGRLIHIFGSPYSPRSVVVPVGGGVVRTEGGEYTLEYFDGRGTPLRMVVRDVARDSVRQVEFDSATADWTRFSAENPMVACTGTIERYRFKPAIRALLPDADGRLWVETRQVGGFMYEVWSGDSLLARVPAPDREAGIPPAMLGDRLAVVAESPDGGHEVRLYRVRGPSP
jgi:hypothetical protein